MPREGPFSLEPLLERSSDGDLARLTVGGDRAAYAVLVRRGTGPALALLRRMGAQPATAEDIVQEALVAGWRAIATYRGEAPFAAWLMKIAGRLYVKRIRKDSRLELRAEPVEQDVGAADFSSHERLDLDQAMSRLSPAERTCVALCHGAGLTHEEIGVGLNMPVGTVKSHVRRGVMKLRLWLDPEGENGNDA